VSSAVTVVPMLVQGASGSGKTHWIRSVVRLSYRPFVWVAGSDLMQTDGWFCGHGEKERGERKEERQRRKTKRKGKEKRQRRKTKTKGKEERQRRKTKTKGKEERQRRKIKRKGKEERQRRKTKRKGGRF